MSAPELGPTPALDVDPFSLEFLAGLYPERATLRDARAVVRRRRYGIWTVARHAEISAVLQDWRTCCSGRGGGLRDFVKDNS